MAMIGSCVSIFALSGIYQESINMIMVHRATVVGGVVIGASVHFIYFPVLAIVFGVLGGVVCFFSLRYLQGRC